MLQIFVYGPTAEGFLELGDKAVLNIEATDELFDEDFTLGEFSLPVEVPWSDTNRKLLGFAERLTNFITRDNYFTCDVYDSGFPEMLQAKLTILERAGSLNYRRGSFSCSISGTKGLFGSLIRNKKLSNLALGGVVSWAGSGLDSKGFAKAVMNGDFPQYSYLGFAPVAIENFIDTERKDYTTEFLAKDVVNHIMPHSGDWLFTSPIVANPSDPALIGDADYINSWTVPFLNLKYVVRKCFEEFGFQASGEYITSTDFDGLFLFNNYAINRFDDVTYYDYNYQLNPANHVPDMLIKDFLKHVAQFHNFYITFRSNSLCELRYRKSRLTDRRVMSITDLTGSSFSAIAQNTDNLKGYSLKYAFDSADQYVGDMVKSLDGKTLAATVSLKADLDDLDQTDFTTDTIALVTSENLYYVVADATVTPCVWEVFAENLDEYKYLDGEKTIELTMSPLCQYVEEDSGLRVRRNMVGCRLPGSYINLKGVRINAPFGLRVFYIKRVETGGITIPVSFNHDTDQAGTKMVPYSLSLSSQAGIAEHLHHAWQLFLLKGEQVQVKMRMNRKIANDMRNADRFELNTVVMMKRQEERTIPTGGSSEMQFVTI